MRNYENRAGGLQRDLSSEVPKDRETGGIVYEYPDQVYIKLRSLGKIKLLQDN